MTFIIPHVNFQQSDWSIGGMKILNVTRQCLIAMKFVIEMRHSILLYLMLISSNLIGQMASDNFECHTACVSDQKWDIWYNEKNITFFTGWQSTLSPRKECDIYIIIK